MSMPWGWNPRKAVVFLRFRHWHGRRCCLAPAVNVADHAIIWVVPMLPRAWGWFSLSLKRADQTFAPTGIEWWWCWWCWLNTAQILKTKQCCNLILGIAGMHKISIVKFDDHSAPQAGVELFCFEMATRIAQGEKKVRLSNPTWSPFFAKPE